MTIEKETINRISEHWQLLNRDYEDYAKVFGLTSLSLWVLEIIYDHPMHCTQKTICEYSQLNKQSVNVIIKSFWEQGYVELIEMKSDRRNKQVKLSEKGRLYVEKVMKHMWKAEEIMLSKLSNEQFEAVLACIEIYEDCMHHAVKEAKDLIQDSMKGGDQ